tara:strand:- start:1668 stop:1823 length:156 start_codon:yes stop_codon:yes gene_type:complete
MQMAAIIALGVFLGDYLDEKNHIDYTYKIIFSLASIFLALYYVLKSLTKLK